jgi:fatty acid desaturase
MRSPASSSVIADQAAMHAALDSTGMDWKTPRARTWRSLSGIATDWAIICLTVWIAYRVGVWASIAAIFVIGNRQRALGNFLHEGGHQNPSNSRDVNDRIACVLLAPPLFNELTLYRLQHAWHHGSLGEPAHDPDYLSSVTHAGDHWFSVYLRVLTTPSIWAGSVFGHFINDRLPLRQKLTIVLWWAACEALLDITIGTHFVLLFFFALDRRASDRVPCHHDVSRNDRSLRARTGRHFFVYPGHTGSWTQFRLPASTSHRLSPDSPPVSAYPLPRPARITYPPEADFRVQSTRDHLQLLRERQSSQRNEVGNSPCLSAH